MNHINEHLVSFRRSRKIPCASAIGIAAMCGLPAATVGQAADSAEIQVSVCQLGLFGYEEYGEKRWTKGPSAVPPDLDAALRAAAVDGRLPCAAAWRLADERGLPRLLVGSIAEAIGVRISDCQLGCF